MIVNHSSYIYLLNEQLLSNYSTDEVLISVLSTDKRTDRESKLTDLNKTFCGHRAV